VKFYGKTLFTVCTMLEAPSNGSLRCTGSPETGLKCSISCNNGFNFDNAVKPIYECGPTTIFLWDFKTDDNPNGNLPSCKPKSRVFQKFRRVCV
jgi:hypothetical protein